MAHRFNVVSVRANDKCCIVVCMVFGTEPRRPIVSGSRVQRRAVEGVHLAAIFGHERQVKMDRFLFGLIKTQ